MRIGLSMACLLVSLSVARAEEVRLVAFNIERGYLPDAELLQIGEIIDQIGPADVWGFEEVSEGDLEVLLARLGDNYEGLFGTRGSDFLALAYDASRFELLDSGEIFLTQISSGERKPLWAQLRSRETGAEFYVVVNHLIRGHDDDPRRSDEARDLNAWAMNHSPAIAIGDFNLDFDVNYTDADRVTVGRQHSAAFDMLVSDDVWVWVRPDVLQPTQCDPQFDSVLDFAFVAGAARNWPRESRIIDTGCDDDALHPDHLPIDLVITVD